MEEETHVHRRKFLRQAALGATGLLALSLNHTPLKTEEPQTDETAPAPQTPKATLMLIGGGYPPLSLQELQNRGNTLTAEECDPLGLFRKLMEQSPKQPPVVEFITNASLKYAEETARQHELIFKKLGAKEVHSVDTHDRKRIINDRTIADRLRRADIVFITGGDQEILADLFLNTDVYKAMCERYATDKDFVIGGTSAGAMIMADHMICGNPKMEGQPTPVGKGFSFLHAAIETHMGARGREPRLLSAIEQHPGTIGIGLDNTTAVIIKDGRATVHGSGRALVTCNKGVEIPLDEKNRVDLTGLSNCEPYAAKGMKAYSHVAGESFELGRFAKLPEAVHSQIGHNAIRHHR